MLKVGLEESAWGSAVRAAGSSCGCGCRCRPGCGRGCGGPATGLRGTALRVVVAGGGVGGGEGRRTVASGGGCASRGLLWCSCRRRRGPGRWRRWSRRRRSTGVAWSAWRIGASHQGVRQVWSRRAMNWRSAPVKQPPRESIATSSPVGGVGVEPAQPEGCRCRGPGRGPTGRGRGRSRPGGPGSWSPANRVWSVITRWTSTGTSVGGGLAGDPFDQGVGHDLARGCGRRRRPRAVSACRVRAA